MSNSNQPTAESDKLGTRSSIYARVPRELRAKINQAIADADPPSYRGIYDRFDLESLGVTFTPFYYYARRIRHHIQLLEIANIAGPPDADTAAAVHKLVVQRFIEIMLRREVSSRCMLRLAIAYRMTAQAKPAKQKSADTEAWTKVLRAVMSLPPTPAELDDAAGSAEPPIRARSPSAGSAATPNDSSVQQQATSTQESHSPSESPNDPLVRESAPRPPPVRESRPPLMSAAADVNGRAPSAECNAACPDTPPAADPRFSDVAATQMKKMLLDRIRPGLNRALDEREHLAASLHAGKRGDTS